MLNVRHLRKRSLLFTLFAAGLVLAACQSEPASKHSGDQNRPNTQNSTTDADAHQAAPPPGGEASAVALNGNFGMSAEWESGWLDLPAPMGFRQGDRLALTVAGSARKIIVRLLSQGASADSPMGIVGGPVSVPSSGIVEVTLLQDYPTVRQISVHGGQNPWGLFDLGNAHGGVSLQAVKLYRHK
jgi:hypothetical protein